MNIKLINKKHIVNRFDVRRPILSDQELIWQGEAYPLWVYRDQDQYVLIDGRKRWQAATTAEVAVIVDDSVQTEQQAWQKSLALNGLSLGVADQLAVYHYWAAQNKSLSELRIWLPALSAWHPLEIAEQFWSIATSPDYDKLIQKIEEGGINWRQASLAIEANLAQLILPLQLNANEQKVVIQMLQDLAKKERLSLEEMCQRLELNSILNAEISPREKYKAIRERLQQSRYPRITEVNQKIEQTQKQLKEPRFVKVDLPVDLEGDALLLQAQLKSLKDIQNLNQWLNQQQGVLDELLGYL